LRPGCARCRAGQRLRRGKGVPSGRRIAEGPPLLVPRALRARLPCCAALAPARPAGRVAPPLRPKFP
ncbi:MAG: hypothetical protein ACK5YF_02580, partial [Rhodobacterales bacterium]